MKYIHYGSNKFDKDKFLRVKNCDHDWTKPQEGGFWASRVDAEYGWRQWCEREDFHINNLNKSFKFDLTTNAKIFHIRNYEDLKKLPRLSNIVQYIPITSLYYKIDFEKTSKLFDAIELHLSEDKNSNYKESLYFKLYGWDCDSILIMNPDVIIC